MGRVTSPYAPISAFQRLSDSPSPMESLPVSVYHHCCFDDQSRAMRLQSRNRKVPLGNLIRKEAPILYEHGVCKVWILLIFVGMCGSKRSHCVNRVWACCLGTGSRQKSCKQDCHAAAWTHVRQTCSI